MPYGQRTTERLRLEPITRAHAHDLWRLHHDEVVAAWNAGGWSSEQALAFAEGSEKRWRDDGVGKWMAYDRRTGALIGRGGLSRVPVSSAWFDQVVGMIDDDGWANGRLEIGWAIRDASQGQGYASEIGREGLAFAFGVLDASRVVAFTEVHNHASRRVMERIGMAHVGEILGSGLIEGRDGVHDGAPFALYSTGPVRGTGGSSPVAPAGAAGGPL